MKGNALKLSRDAERAILKESSATGIRPDKILNDAIWLGLGYLKTTYEPLKNIGASARQLAEQGEPQEEIEAMVPLKDPQEEEPPEELDPEDRTLNGDLEPVWKTVVKGGEQAGAEIGPFHNHERPTEAE